MFEKVRPLDDIALNVLQKRYFRSGETAWEHVVDRTINWVIGVKHPDYADIRRMLLNRYFIPNSPTLFNSGVPGAGLSGCYVTDLPDNTEGIMKTFSDFVQICRHGGGAGTTLSKMRPKGARVGGSTHGHAIGPIDLYDSLMHLMKGWSQAGVRSMACMGTMIVTHPDIKKFISAKSEEGLMETTNLSVVVTDEFMSAVEADGTYWTEFSGENYEELRARDVFQMIVDGAWRNGEPGLIFYEKINQSPYAWTGQAVEATNPCGEQGLPANGVCNLGSLDLSKFLHNGELDWSLLHDAVRLSVEFLDRVIDVNAFPTQEIATFAAENRPVGLGIMGFADYLLQRGIIYGSQGSVEELDKIMKFIYEAAKKKSEELGRERGVPVQCQKLPQPRRNITLLSIAPTGTISLIAGCSSGIEPIFSEVITRKDNTGAYQINHPDHDQPYFRCAVSANGATEVSWQEHIAVLEAAQRWVDSGVSKTINCPQGTHRDTVWEMFMQAWKSPTIKGLTIYRNQSRKVEVLSPKLLKKDHCPVCGALLIKEGGCKHCSECDFSVCEIG